MFSTRFFIKPCYNRPYVRTQSTISVRTVKARSLGLGSAATAIGTLAVTWYGGKYYLNERPKAANVQRLSNLPSIDPESKYPFQFLAPPTPAEVTKILNQNTWSFTNISVPGVSRCDGAQIPANGLIEDRFLYGIFPSPFQKDGGALEKDWLALGVFDGHSGSQTSEAVSTSILPYVYNSLRKLTRSANGTSIDKAIMDGFLALDDVFIGQIQQKMNSKASFAEKVLRLAPGFNGSCALLALFDPSTRTLRVACTGDSRAVLGYQTAEGKWETRPLSVDQNVKNAAEVERVRCEHPNEENLIRESYYMGYEPTRVFGDGKSKWPLELSNEAKERFNAGHAQKPERYKTPPYHTARPEVVTTQLEKGRPAFMILASDGVWDTMSSEQGVALVGRWVDWVKAGKPAQKEVSEFGEFDLKEEGALDFKEAKTTVQDENVGVHLIRNALGGAHHDMVSGLLSFKPPFARKVRDDMTVQVVFFD